MNIRLPIYELHRNTCCDLRENWLREKESNLHLRVQSPTCCRLHHPAIKLVQSLKSNVQSLFRYGGLGHSTLDTGCWSRRQELNRHRSIINRVLWPLSYTAK